MRSSSPWSLRVSGLLYDHLGSYQLPFLLAGVPPVVCSVLMFAVRCVPDDAKDEASENGLMVKSCSPLEPVGDKLNGHHHGAAATIRAAGQATGTWVPLLVEERLCVRIALLAAPRSPGRLQSYSLLA